MNDAADPRDNDGTGAAGPDAVNANDVVAFGVELLALAMLGAWGAGLGTTTGAHVAGGVLVPLVAIVLWGLFAAPRAVVRVPALALVTKVVVLGGGALASFAVLPLGWAVAATAAVVVNSVLTRVGPFAHPVRREPLP